MENFNSCSIECCQDDEGEHFYIKFIDTTKGKLVDFTERLTEDELRAELSKLGRSPEQVDEGIRIARKEAAERTTPIR